MNWPILKRLVRNCVAVSDESTRAALGWLYRSHGLRVEPSGGITVAAGLQNQIDFGGAGDVVFVISGRNVDDDRFAEYILPTQ